MKCSEALVFRVMKSSQDNYKVDIANPGVTSKLVTLSLVMHTK